MTSRPDLQHQWSLLGLAAQLIRATPGRQAVNALCHLVSDMAMPLTAVGLKLLTDGIIDGDLRRAVWGGLVTAGGSVLVDGMNWTGMALHFALVERVGRFVDEQLMRWAADVPGIEHHERADYHDRIQLLRDQRDQLANLPEAFTGTATMVVRSILTLGLLAAVHPALLVLPVFGIPSLVIARRAALHQLAASEEVAPTRRLINSLFGLATESKAANEVRVFGLQATLQQRHNHEWRTLDATLRRAERRAAVSSAAGWAVFAFGFVAAVGFVVWRSTRGEATAGDVALTLILAGQVNGQLNYAASTVSWLQDSLKAAARYLWLADYTGHAIAAVAPAEPRPVPATLTSGIRLHDVSFRYPGTETTILHGVDLFLPAGHTIALVGDNGAGKTTLVKLLCRLYEPSEGTITVEGTAMTSFTPAAWRERISAAFQDFARFQFLARETVGVGDVAGIDRDDLLVSALISAAGMDVVDQLPSGLDTQLGRTFEGGVELSGGQWQKLALGRAMMRSEPLLLVLDEPTAALDAQTEHALFERYTRAANRIAATNGAITLLVSHRFSTVRVADVIIVLQDGRVVAVGSHVELVAQGGLYAELYELQARAYR